MKIAIVTGAYGAIGKAIARASPKRSTIKLLCLAVIRYCSGMPLRMSENNPAILK
jgi:short-subunit dehydrogenase